MNEQKPTVQSVARTFTILEDLCIHPKGRTIKELTSETGLSKSTVHRLLENLIILGYATQSVMDDRYHASLKMFEVGSHLIGNIDLISITRPYLNKLAFEVEETVHLVLQNDADVVYVFKAEAGHLSMSSRIGSRLPMYCSGTGKAMLALKSDDEVKQLWKRSMVQKLTPNTIDSLGGLQAQIASIRASGWAFDDEENEVGISCVAVALPQITGLPHAAFSISGMKAVMTNERVAFLAKKCLEVKQEILNELRIR